MLCSVKIHRTFHKYGNKITKQNTLLKKKCLVSLSSLCSSLPNAWLTATHPTLAGKLPPACRPVLALFIEHLELYKIKLDSQSCNSKF